jgi:hypothetical protein
MMKQHAYDQKRHTLLLKLLMGAARHAMTLHMGR